MTTSSIDRPFPDVYDLVQFEGIQSKNPLAFKFYNPERIVEGKPMSEHLPFAFAYWHGMRGAGTDMFGEGTFLRPWEDASIPPMENAKNRLRVAFKAMYLLGIKRWCWHDWDLVPFGNSISDFHQNIEDMVPLIKELQAEHGIRCGWTTQNLFSHPMYRKGAATSPDPRVYAHAVAQSTFMLDVGKEIGAEGHVFWGGREGYETLKNTDMGFEQDRLAQFLTTMSDYAASIGFKGNLLIEPKPCEPSTFQYDYSAAVVIDFLRNYDLFGKFGLNLETNHAELAGLSMAHELTVAMQNDALGGVDANQGTANNGWDTDELPWNPMNSLEMFLVMLNHGGMKSGVINFDAKPRRTSTDPTDILRAHIVGMDCMAHGLRAAAFLREEGELARMIEERYSGWHGLFGEQILSGLSVKEIRASAYAHPPVVLPSDQVEVINAMFGRALAMVGANN
jgi:xylose isomerase